MMLQPKIMEYWRGFDSSRGLECGNIMRYEIVFRVHDSKNLLVVSDMHCNSDLFPQHHWDVALRLILEYPTE